jgi:sulfoxide reductase heme-binding subunit YedZ
MRKWFISLAIIVFVGLSFNFIFNNQTSAQTAVQSTSSGGSVIVNPIPGPTLAQKAVTRTVKSWPWYVVRGSGIIAAVSMIILLLSGVGFITGHTFKFLEPIIAWASHRALGIVFGISILIHMFGLLFDHFIPFNLLNLLVPWSSRYKPVTIFGVNFGSLYVSLGVFAFYMVALITVYSLLWIDKKPYSWKLTHLLSYVVFVFVFIHALFLGTDLAGGIFRIIWIASGIGVSIAIIVRLWRAKTI